MQIWSKSSRGQKGGETRPDCCTLLRSLLHRSIWWRGSQLTCFSFIAILYEHMSWDLSQTESILVVMPKEIWPMIDWNTPKTRECSFRATIKWKKTAHAESCQNDGALFLWILWCRIRCGLCLKLSPHSRHL